MSLAILPVVMGTVAGLTLAIRRRRTGLVKMVRKVTPAISHRRRRLVQAVRRRLIRTRPRPKGAAQPTPS